MLKQKITVEKELSQDAKYSQFAPKKYVFEQLKGFICNAVVCFLKKILLREGLEMSCTLRKNLKSKCNWLKENTSAFLKEDYF